MPNSQRRPRLGSNNGPHRGVLNNRKRTHLAATVEVEQGIRLINRLYTADRDGQMRQIKLCPQKPWGCAGSA